MLPFFIGLLKFLVAIDCLLLILIVLMQRPRQEGLGAAFGSGVMDQLAGAQTTNVLQKITTWLGILLFFFTFVLAILVAKADDRTTGSKLITDADKKAAATAPAAPAPTAPTATSPAVPAPAEAPKAPEAKPVESKPAPEAPAKPAAEAPKPAENNPAPAPAPAAPVPSAAPTAPPATPATPAPAEAK